MSEYRIEPWIPVGTMGIEAIIMLFIGYKGMPLWYGFVIAFGCAGFLFVSRPLWIVRDIVVPEKEE